VLGRPYKWRLRQSRALQIATINPALQYHLRNFGAIASALLGGLIVFDDLKKFEVLSKLIKKEDWVAEKGRYLSSFRSCVASNRAAR